MGDIAAQQASKTAMTRLLNRQKKIYGWNLDLYRVEVSTCESDQHSSETALSGIRTVGRPYIERHASTTIYRFSLSCVTWLHFNCLEGCCLVCLTNVKYSHAFTFTASILVPDFMIFPRPCWLSWVARVLPRSRTHVWYSKMTELQYGRSYDHFSSVQHRAGHVDVFRAKSSIS